jgi:SOS response regulatory protein OraA/RecX
MKREEAINLIGWLKSKTNRDDDLEAIDMAIDALSEEKISRAELFNKLATVNAPMEANAYKAEVYRIINEM